MTEDPAGHHTVVRGTDAPLEATAAVEVFGETVPPSSSTALAFDLTVTRVSTDRG